MRKYEYLNNYWKRKETSKQENSKMKKEIIWNKNYGTYYTLI